MSKVLLVDDEPRILLLLQSLLKTNKYEVETARDGNAALDIVRVGGTKDIPVDVRELENAIKHALTFLGDGDITPDLLPPKILQHAQAAAAAALKVNLSTLYRKLSDDPKEG